MSENIIPQMTIRLIDKDEYDHMKTHCAWCDSTENLRGFMVGKLCASCFDEADKAMKKIGE